MNEPALGNWRIYAAIVGISCLLCFAWLMTGNLWFTITIMSIGALHAARYFPSAEAFIREDPVLVWTRRISPLLVLVIAGVVYATGIQS